MTQDFIDKYSALITDNICKAHNIDPQDLEVRATLAYNLSNDQSSSQDLCITFSNEGKPFSLSVKDCKWNGVIEYSLDKCNWSKWSGEELNSSNEIYLRGINNTVITRRNSVNSGPNNVRFNFTGSSCTGNIEVLLDYKTVESGQHPEMKDHCFESLFYNCNNLKNVPLLPALNLTQCCYMNMFAYCTSLVKAPMLPATKLSSYCYYYMFDHCVSLTEAPELPAVELEEGCYSAMFAYCKSLSKDPDLKALKLADRCYESMFMDCMSLIQTPELPASDLAYSCYASMFNGCKSLIKATNLPVINIVDSCYTGMFDGCDSLTDIPDAYKKYLEEYKLRKHVIDFFVKTYPWDSDTIRESNLRSEANYYLSTDIISNYPDFLAWDVEKQHAVIEAYAMYSCGDSDGSWGYDGQPPYSEVCKEFMDKAIRLYNENNTLVKALQPLKNRIIEYCKTSEYNMSDVDINYYASKQYHNKLTFAQIFANINYDMESKRK